MPQDGINGTVMKGQYKISKVTINKKLLKNDNDFKLYYTSDSEYKGKKAGEITKDDLNKTDTEGNKVWKEATQTDEGEDVKFTGTGLIGSWPAAIVYVDDNLKKDTIAKIKLEYNAKVAEGDKLSNSLSAPGNEGSTLNDETQVKIYKRTLEGTVWVDKDKDGKLGTSDDETLFKGAKVTLLKKDADGNYVPFDAYEEITVDKGGKVTTVKHPTTVNTDENGHYKFEGLPEGEFKVIFESGDNSIEDYNVTDFDKGNKEQSSKVDTGYVDKNGRKLQSGTITEITMPSIKEMESQGKTTYNLPDQNLGLIEQKVDVPVSKTWDDADNQDGMRSDSITVRLYADGVQTDKTEVLSSANEWKAKFTDLPQYKDDEGNEIKYTVEEEKVPEGYTASISGDAKNGYNITNTHQTQTVDIPVTKVWNDDNNRDGLRSNEVIVELLADGKETGKQVKLNDANNWSSTFTKLPVKHAGKAIEYTLKEVQVPDGYQSVITGSATAGFVITNTHNPEKVSIEGQKTWQDKDNQDGIRPEKITVKVMNGDEVVTTQEVTSKNNWKYTFDGLDKYKDGQVIIYTISEDAVEGYTPSYDGCNITNTHEVATTSVKVTKAWDDHDDQDGKRPDSVVVHLYANGEKTDQTVELSNDNNWMAVFDNLDKFKDGQVIQYTVEEEKVNSYKATVTGDQDQGFVITNTYQKDSTPVADQPHSDKPSQNNKSNSKKSHVSTGDNQEVGLFGLMGLLSLSGLTFLKKKKKRRLII